jgi:hypothetical protein
MEKEIILSCNKTLSVDIINIIIKYNDLSIYNMKKKLNKKRIEVLFKIKNFITIEDIFMRCILHGYTGFYISLRYHLLIEQVDNLIAITNKNINIQQFENRKRYRLIEPEDDIFCDMLRFQELYELVDIRKN